MIFYLATSMPKHEIYDAHVQKFKLAMAWNKFDLAVSDMFIENVKTQWTVSIINEENLNF